MFTNDRREMLTYKERETLKSRFLDTVFDEDQPLARRVRALEGVLYMWYIRSLSVSNDSEEHPLFGSYVAMILNQGEDRLPLSFEGDVYEALVKEYGKKKGIRKGSYYHG